MNEMDKSISELHTILKTAEQNIKSKPSHVLMVQNRKGFKNKGKARARARARARAKESPMLNPNPNLNPRLKPQRRVFVSFTMNLVIGRETASCI